MLDLVFVFLVFGTSMPSGLFGFPTDINFLSREWYRGTTRGVEISYLDLLAVVLLVSSLVVRQKEGRKMFWPPTLGLLIAYFVWSFFNVAIFSDPKIFGFFELTKLLRAMLLFVAVCAYIRSPREIHVFVWALAGTMFYEALVCLRARYVYGINRVFGTMAHPNSLSMYALQCMPIFVTAFFAKGISKALQITCVLAYLAAAGCILLSISRTGFAALILLSGLSFVLSTGFRLTPRKVGIAVLGMLLVGGMLAKSWDTAMSRLGGVDLGREYLTSEGDRGSYFRQAAPAIAENPLFGLGLNNWCWWVTNRYATMAGYDYTTDNLPIVPYTSTAFAPGSPGQFPPAHNLYLLTLTELGLPGFLLFGAFLLQSLWVSGSAMTGGRESLITLIRLGAFLSLCGVLMQSFTEWEFRQTPMFFLGHIIMAVGATLYHYRERVPRS